MKFVYMMMLLFVTGCSVVKDCSDSDTISILEKLSVEIVAGEIASNMKGMWDVDINTIQTISHSKDPEKYECTANIHVTYKEGSELDKYLEKGKLKEKFANLSIPTTLHYSSYSVNYDGDDTHVVSAVSEDGPNYMMFFLLEDFTK